MNSFRDNVIAFVSKVPRGKVVSYGQVAAACGNPRAARQVGGILKSFNALDGGIPWWRVLNNKGIITIKGNWAATKELQRELLLRESVEVGEDFTIDIEKYRY